SPGNPLMPGRLQALATLDEHLQQVLLPDARVGVMLVRLLRLRELNILFGYEHGQRLVETAAATIAAALRPLDIVMRVGENEFVLVLPDLLSPNHAMLAAHRVVRAF